MPKLFRVVAPVTDIEKARRFYEAVLGAKGHLVSPGRLYFDCEGTILACLDPRRDQEGYDARPNPEHHYFAVDDLEACYAAVPRAGGALSAEGDEFHGPFGKIQVRPWGERSFYADDLFGNPLCFVDRRTLFTGG